MTLAKYVVAAVVATAAFVAPATGSAASSRSLVPPFLSSGTDQLRPGAAARIARIRWRRTASGGATVLVSSAYDADPTTGRRWAAFFESLIHGPELSLLTAHIATPAEINEICPEALGCYASNTLWISDETLYAVSPQEVAAHEYGHHVAFNRLNPPWVAVNWGTKRWSTAMNICSRVGTLTAFPGNEGPFYTLNPGEAFAETYRVLNGYGLGDWPIVDQSFMPTTAGLAAVRADVVTPWTAPTQESLHVRFRSGKRVWAYRLSTPLDGKLDVTLPVGSDDIELVSDGKTVARGMWGTTGGKSLTYQVCGERSFTLKVTRSGGPKAFTVKVSHP
jgi:hypothetical protein